MRVQGRFAAHAPAFVCDPHGPKPRRYPQRPADARPRRYLDHADLHTHHRRPPKKSIRKLSPAVEEVEPSLVDFDLTVSPLLFIITVAPVAQWIEHLFRKQ